VRKVPLGSCTTIGNQEMSLQAISVVPATGFSAKPTQDAVPLSSAPVSRIVECLLVFEGSLLWQKSCSLPSIFDRGVSVLVLLCPQVPPPAGFVFFLAELRKRLSGLVLLLLGIYLPHSPSSFFVKPPPTPPPPEETHSILWPNFLLG
jgi:hypothetical protein